MKTGLFIGRFQPLHEGHIACINHILAESDVVIVGIRETKKDDRNPLGLQDRWDAIRKAFPDRERVVIKVIEDPGCELTVYIGRDVGYDLIKLDESTERIRATDLRKQLEEARR